MYLYKICMDNLFQIYHISTIDILIVNKKDIELLYIFYNIHSVAIKYVQGIVTIAIVNATFIRIFPSSITL